MLKLSPQGDKKPAQADMIAGPHGDQVRSDETSFSAVLALLRYGKGTYGKLGFAIGLVTLSSLAVITSAKLLGNLVEALAASQRGQPIWGLAAGILALETLAVVATYFGRVGLATVTNDISYRIRCELFQKLSLLPISYFDRQPLGRTITRLTYDVEGIEDFFSNTLARLLSAGINIVLVMIAMLLTDLKFGAVIVLVSLPGLLFTVVTRFPVREWLRAVKRRGAHVNAKLAEFLGGLAVIKIFGLEDWSLDDFREAAQDHLDANIQLLQWNALIRPVMMFLCGLPTLVILWWGGAQVLSGTLSLGLVVAFVRYSERFSGPVRAISQEIQVVQQALASSERVRQMLGEPEEQDVLGPDGSLARRLLGHVTLAQVWMGYDADTPVLKGISMDVRAGMKIGLVGETGSGKSSTLNLLPRLYPISQGRILIDGTDVAQWSRSALRRQLGVVSQDIVVFRGTLRENLVAAAEHPDRVSDETVRRAAEQTGLWEVVRQFPKGLQTDILEGGENLSMGERQLVALTRMLIRDPAVLMLDEATANIDERCEKLVQRAVGSLLEGRTCFIIAHRLSTILQCDRIYVFSGGRIIEEGTHAELMAAGAHYAALASRQLQAGEFSDLMTEPGLAGPANRDAKMARAQSACET